MFESSSSFIARTFELNIIYLIVSFCLFLISFFLNLLNCFYYCFIFTSLHSSIFVPSRPVPLRIHIYNQFYYNILSNHSNNVSFNILWCCCCCCCCCYCCQATSGCFCSNGFAKSVWTFRTKISTKGESSCGYIQLFSKHYIVAFSDVLLLTACTEKSNN